MGEPLRVGMIGAGNISGQYLATFDRLDGITLVAVAELDAARAEAAVAGRPGARAMSIDELLADPAVDLVLNLTLPASHAEIALTAIAAGKSVYGEKPLAATVADARRVLAAAAAAGVRVGCAPDTVLGTGTQTARKAIDDGIIGEPVSATATMVTPGHEAWHPNPDFYYQPGAGPLMDMGPYYLSSLVSLLGPVATVVGAGSHTRSSRSIASGPRAGSVFPVDVDSHVTALLTHESGAITTMLMTFDAVATRAANLEIHGQLGSMIVPDPNTFDGDVEVALLGGDGWHTLPVSAGYVGGGRGIGILDLSSTAPSAEPRAGGELAFHVLEVMEAILASTRSGVTIAIESRPSRPGLVPLTA